MIFSRIAARTHHHPLTVNPVFMTVVGCLTQLVVERSSVFKAPPVVLLLLEMQLCGFFLFLLPEMVESSIEPSHVVRGSLGSAEA